MLRSTTLVLAISCAIACTSYGQQPSATQAPTAVSPAAGQGAADSSKSADTKTASATNVPPSEPVITLKGACPAKAGAPPKGCVTTMTREQFEKLIEALQPADRGPVSPDIKRKFASQYAKLLTLSDAARELGLENDPKVQEIYGFARNQILAEALNQHYLEQYAHPSDKEIQDYYDKNIKQYREVTLQRIIIPTSQNITDKTKPKPSDEEQKAFADKLRERWTAGEDPGKLQKEAMEHAGMTSSSPDVNMGTRRPGSLPQQHESVFDLKAGDISQLYTDPAAFYIYKIVSVRTMPLSEVKTNIEQTLQRQMHQDKMQEIQASVTPVLNDAYFGPEPPANAGPSMRPGMPGMPPGRPGAGGPPPGAGAGPAPAPPPGAQNSNPPPDK